MSHLRRAEPAPGVVELRLDRPEQRNALDTALLHDLRDAIRAISDDRSAKVVLLTGEGATFCAGADLKEFASGADPADTLARVRLVMQCMRGLQELEPVTLSLVHGGVVGAGWGLALACDLCWAAGDTTFRLPEVAKGFRIPRPIVGRLAQVVGPVRAAEIILGGAPVDAGAALAMGAVGRCHPDVSSGRAAAEAFATELAALPRSVLAGAVDPLRHLAVPDAIPALEYQWPESRA